MKRKKFNVAGPCFPDEHYMLPALGRLPKIRRLVDYDTYFVLHAPRQSGKTTALQALVREINADGEAYALYCTLETLQNATDPEKASAKIAAILHENVESDPAFPNPFMACESEPAAVRESALAVRAELRRICRDASKPVVVFFDEADCLFGDVLVSFLRQLRDGYVNRHTIPFPASIALVGMLDIRDYKAQIRSDGESLGQISPFNIISEDLMLRNFTEDEVSRLYSQHTETTEQVFEPDAVAKAFELTCGQPWLVNALARECVEKIHDFDFSAPITAEDMVTAKETIIRRRPIHLDYLLETVKSPRMAEILQSALDGDDVSKFSRTRHFKLLCELGIVEAKGMNLRFSNPIYEESFGNLLSTNSNCPKLSTNANEN